MADEAMGVADAPVTQEAGSGVAENGNLSFDQLGNVFARNYPQESEAMSEEGEAEPDEQVTTGEAETEDDSWAEETSEEADTADEAVEDPDDEVLSQ